MKLYIKCCEIIKNYLDFSNPWNGIPLGECYFIFSFFNMLEFYYGNIPELLHLLLLLLIYLAYFVNMKLSEDFF